MAIPTTIVRMSAIAAEFGGTTPHSLSAEYFRGGGRVPAGQATSAVDGTAIPTSANTLIRIGMFRGLSSTANFPQNTTNNFFINNYTGSFNGSTGTASASITFNTNGTISYSTTNNPETGLNYWYQPTTTNIGASYWIRATLASTVSNLNGGSFSRSGTTGTWLQLNSARQWSLSVTGLNSEISDNYTFQFSTSSTGSPIIASFTDNSITTVFADLR